jgi:hypothetical protein
MAAAEAAQHGWQGGIIAFRCRAQGNTSLVSTSAACIPSSPTPAPSHQGQLGLGAAHLELDGQDLHLKQIPCSWNCSVGEGGGG